MKGYTKLFARILNSSIWDEDDKTRLVWITMLAMADENGQVISTMKSLALNARVDPPDAEKAIERFLAPDPDTLTADFEGRRIEKIEGGWFLLNHRKFREMMSLEERREYYRKKRAEYRQKEKEARKGMTAREIIREKIEAEDRENARISE